MKILGIDPGLNGAVAMWQPGAVPAWAVADLPTVGEGAQRRINAPALRDWVRERRPDRAFIESVHAMPAEAASFSYRFGRAVGAIEAVVAACDVPVDLVVPQTWKRFYGLRGPDKEQSRALTIRRFPEASRHLQRKLDHGRAEAILIAAYGAAAVGAISSMSPLDLPPPLSTGPVGIAS